VNISNSVERVYIAGKACEEHTACEDKAFEEMEIIVTLLLCGF
jgi:hypothetical protein